MNRRWTIRTRILTLLFAPLVPLLAMLIFATSVALGPAVNLRNANTAAVQGGLPAATVLLDLQTERELSVILVSSPTAVPQAVSALTNARAQTDSAYGSLQKAVTGGAFTAAANDQVVRYLDVLKAQLVKLEPTRNAVDRGTSRLTVMTFYNAAIESTFGLYGAIEQPRRPRARPAGQHRDGAGRVQRDARPRRRAAGRAAHLGRDDDQRLPAARRHDLHQALPVRAGHPVPDR